MITQKSLPPQIHVEAPIVKVEPKITVESPKVNLYPEVHVAPAETKVFVQSIPAPKVDVQVQPAKPCSWVFEIERDREGNISRITAAPQS